MSPLPESLENVVKRFRRLSTPKQRNEQLIWYMKRLKPLPAEAAIAANRVQGCASTVYITATLDQGKVWYQGDADAVLVKGLVAALVEGLSGLTPDQVLQISPDFITEMGLNESLSTNRAGGFRSIFDFMQARAAVLKLAEESMLSCAD
ncbi:MAG: SufE family protein [Cyanobacteria bacterium]|nr:SufE family protein [Cyanobacteriota bacterium]MDW8202624.1 SufE family protein [Cyanobacteriota bacterium SKYGB_h_bin112]